MSFVPYEHVAAHDTPVYVGESTRMPDSNETSLGKKIDVNKLKLGKRKISAGRNSPPPLKDLTNTTKYTTSPSRPQTHHATSSIRPGSSSDTTTMPEAVTPKALARSCPRSYSHKKRRSSLFLGLSSSPAAQQGKSSSSSPAEIKPSLPGATDTTEQKSHVESSRAKTEEPSGTRSPIPALLHPQNLRVNSERGVNIIEYLSPPIVHVSIGKLPKVYAVHKKLLCLYSQFFRARLQTADPSISPLEVILPDIKDPAFGLVVHWLYSGTLNHVPDGINGLFPLYYLTEELGIPLLGNSVMDAIRDCYRSNPVPNYPGIGRIHQVYGKTTTGSPLRRFVVQAAYWKLIKEGSNVDEYIIGADIGGDFVRDFMKTAQKKARETAEDIDPRSCAACIFHIYDERGCCTSPPLKK